MSNQTKRLGVIDLDDFEYLVVYSEPETPEVINTWTLPESSFQLNYKSMINRGCIIYNVYHRIHKDQLQSFLK